MKEERLTSSNHATLAKFRIRDGPYLFKMVADVQYQYFYQKKTLYISMTTPPASSV